MNKKISLHIPTGNAPVIPPISLPIPSHVSISQSPPTPTAPPQQQPSPLLQPQQQLQPPHQQPPHHQRYNTSPLKSSSSTHSLPRHKPTRSDMMRTEARRAAAEQMSLKEKERQARDDERDRVIRARAKRRSKQQSMDHYHELLGHSQDNMDLLEISLYHEENRPQHIPKLSMDRAMEMITPRENDENKEQKQEYDEEFEEYEESQPQEEESELSSMLSNGNASSVSSRISPSCQKPPISPMKASPSPSHTARCAVDGCHQTRTSRGYCSLHAAMHSPLTSPITKNKHVSTKSTSSISEDDDLSLNDSMEYDASINVTIHKPPIMEGLKLDFSNMDLHHNRHLWAVDNVSDSFEITKSGTFKRGDFSLNKRGLSVRSHDPIEDSTPRIPTIVTDENTSTRTRKGSKTKNYQIHPEDLVILNVLGRGSSGVVYRCFDLPSLSLIALKSISITEQDKRKQLSRELVTLANDPSPYLIGFKGAYFDEGHIYMALEYMNHGSLQDWIDTHGPLTEWSLAYIFDRVLHGLAHLHSHQKVHRDIKPHNILINDHGEIKVADFGIMGTITESIDACKTFVGTLIYMSPERLGGASYDYSCDIWSMGLAFLTCALGTYAIPHTGHFELITKIQNAAKLVDDLPSKYSRDLKSFVASCLNAEPSARPTAQQLLDHPFLVRFREGPTHEIPVPPEFAPSALVSARNSITNKDMMIRHKDPTQPETARRGSVTTNAVIAAHLGDATGTAAALARDKYDNTAKICEALVKHNYMSKTPETPDRKRANDTLTQQQLRIIANQLEVPQQLVHTLYTEREKKYVGLAASPSEV